MRFQESGGKSVYHVLSKSTRYGFTKSPNYPVLSTNGWPELAVEERTPPLQSREVCHVIGILKRGVLVCIYHFISSLCECARACVKSQYN